MSTKKMDETMEEMDELEQLRARIPYRQEGDYLVPDLKIPPQPDVELGRYAELRAKWLEKKRPWVYTEYLVTFTMVEKLYENEQRALALEEKLTKELAQREGLTDELKNDNPMEWVRLTNSIKNRVEEIVLNEVVYTD